MRCFLVLFLSIWFLPLWAQEPVTLAYSRPDEPGHLRVELLFGKIQVIGTDEKRLRMEATPLRTSSGTATGKGLPRVGGPTAGLRVTEADNHVVVKAPNPYPGLALTLHVPRQTSLLINLQKGQGIAVTGVWGELELNAETGPINLREIRGSVVAHALNDNIEAHFERVTPGKAMSFSSMTGNIAVSFPDGVNADLRLVAYRGEIFSDLKAGFKTRGTFTEEDGRAGGGAYQLDYEQALHGHLGEGGPEFLFKSYRGNLYITGNNPD